MILWRLSADRRAQDLSGGYGLYNSGRWNSVGRPIIYASNNAALPVLEKRVHALHPALLPPQVMVTYSIPDTVYSEILGEGNLPTGWQTNEAATQQLGDRWLDSQRCLLLFVPSVIVPIFGAPDRNVLINPMHPDLVKISITDVSPFSMDVRLFSP